MMLHQLLNLVIIGTKMACLLISIEPSLMIRAKGLIQDKYAILPV